MTLQEYVNSIKNKRIAVIGIGVSNTPLIELLLSNSCDVTACDKRTEEKMGEEAARLRSLGAKLKLGDDYLSDIDADIIFRTPGLMPFEPELERAKNSGAVLTSEMEVFMSICPCKMIAITGSDGKTTTSSIIAELLKTGGYKVHLGGNIGTPLLCSAPEMGENDIAVLELSSFQLHSMNCHPNVSVITNISPNHLDKHKDYQDYIDAKMAIFLNQNSSDKLVLHLDDSQTDYYLKSAKSSVCYFSGTQAVSNGVYCDNGNIYSVSNGNKNLIMSADEIRLPGVHNMLNYMAAFAAVEGLVSYDVCRQVAIDFAGVEHRLEHVRDLHGVEYINDSIASSPTRTSAGLRALKTKPIVISGGYDKHIPFDGLGDDFCQLAKAVFLTGDTAEKIYQAIVDSKYYADSRLYVEIKPEFDDAVLAAAKYAQSGDIVILSPGCASFDKFDNFVQRGRHFKKLVMELE